MSAIVRRPNPARLQHCGTFLNHDRLALVRGIEPAEFVPGVVQTTLQAGGIFDLLTMVQPAVHGCFLATSRSMNNVRLGAS